MLAARPLANDHVTLEPLVEGHRAQMAEAGASPSIWTLQPFNIAEGFDAYFDWMLAEKAAGRWVPFAVIDRTGRVVGPALSWQAGSYCTRPFSRNPALVSTFRIPSNCEWGGR